VAARADADWSAAILSGSALGYVRAPTGPAGSAAGASAPADSRVRLLGIAREPARAGKPPIYAQALLKVDQKRILWLRAGEPIEAGMVLAAVDADGVRIDQNGREFRLPLRVPGIAGARAGVATPSSRPSAADACKLTPEQRRRAYVLRPELIDSAMRDRAGWVDVFKATADGLLVQNPGGTGAMLGLYASDLLREAGGARLAGVDDVLRLVLQPLTRNESVVVTGVRSGQPREWIYTGTNCPPR
jgi:hypothetical protein